MFVELRGDYTWIPFSANVLAFFLNYLQEISFNPEMLSEDHSASSHKSERIFFAIFELNVKKEKGDGNWRILRKLKIVKN